MNFAWYGRVKYAGELFIEYPSISYGRRWLDVAVSAQDLEVWCGKLHLTLSAPRESIAIIDNIRDRAANIRRKCVESTSD